MAESDQDRHSQSAGDAQAEPPTQAPGTEPPLFEEAREFVLPDDDVSFEFEYEFRYAEGDTRVLDDEQAKANDHEQPGERG